MQTTNTLLIQIFLAGVTAVANAHDADSNDGWIAHVNDHQLEICYKAEPPAVGQTVQILRSSFITVNKTIVRPVFRPSDL